MITRRRRQGSETEQQLIADSESHQQVVKGPSSGLLWSGSESSFNQPAFYFVPLGEPGATAAPNVAGLNFLDEQTKKATHNSDTMALASLSNSAILSSSNASSRDRTAEFLSAVRSFQSRSTNGMIANHSTQSKNHEQHQQYSEFMKVAKIISKDLSNTYAKLEKLTLLAKKRSLFDDRPQEIQELTYIIREDITNLNKQIAHLQGFMKKQQQNQQQNTKTHSANVVVALQSKLASMSSEFKQVLEVRTENLKAQKTRREQFSGSGPVVSDLPAAALTGGPFGSQNGPRGGSVLLRDAYQAQGGEAVAIDMGASDHQPRMQIQQRVFADETETYLQSRSDAVQSIESTIVELGGIFQQLAVMVREQEEMVQRIDSNVDDAQLNVEAAHDELLRYFRSVSSNRWLMLKVFGIVIVFIVIFAIFFA